MILSVIIVNYNVKFFLEQCLYSVRKAAAMVETEIIVVDNQSDDDSIFYLGPKFPEVKFITSQTNLGFGKACNLGLSEAHGKYILFLNPDTIVAEDSFFKCVRFFEEHTDCGALGVQMIDGSGKFLKESKRSYPSPLTSLFKLSGLARAFPKSRIFGRYHLGHLDPAQTHEVDVLAGAYMMVRRDVLDEVGSFDETFFMYGEDVDLSYRIQHARYKNYYFPGTTIIHFKGESTKRGSLNYVRMFYNAMSIFVHKHYGGTKAGIFSAFIHLAIWARASITAVFRFIRWIGLPVIDALLILFAFWSVKQVWAGFIRTDINYSNPLLFIAFSAFSLIYLTVAYYAGLYDRYYRTANLIRSTSITTLVLLAAYALLPESYRFSRGIVVFGAVTSFVLISIFRAVLIKAGFLFEPADKVSQPSMLVASTTDEFLNVTRFLEQSGLSEKLIGRIAIHEEENGSIASLQNLKQTAKTLNAKEIVFCAGTLSYKNIISEVKNLGGALKVRFYSGCSMVGSDDKATRGEIITGQAPYHLSRAGYKRTKRLIDVVFSIFCFLIFPVQILLVKYPGRLFYNAFQVLRGRKTWVGYISPANGLPKIREGVLGANGEPKSAQQNLPYKSLHLIDQWYATEYEPFHDLKIILNNYKQLDH